MNAETLLCPPEEAAVRLLGANIVAGAVVARIIEVEAYGGRDDPASHAFGGRTPRNGSMFGPAGTMYVYVSYGIHDCANVVCGPEGEPSAVLIRAVEVLQGIGLVERRRGRGVPGGRLIGPGRTCQGLGIHRGHDGLCLFNPASPVQLHEGVGTIGGRVREGTRVGISKATELPWRFQWEPSGEVLEK